MGEISGQTRYIFRPFCSYSDVQFSKTPEKYVKYRPSDVTSMLNSFYDDTI